MKMHITFGMYLDGAEWSDADASIGELRVGPASMLDLLETRLGIGGPAIHPATRINQYMARLTDSDTTDAWFHRSFKLDPWSTAKQLLAWRDELVEVGWTGGTKSSNRLAALSLLEETDGPLSPGREDRLQSVLKSLAHASSVDVASIELIEPANTLPPVWHKIITRLGEIGVAVSTAAGPTGDITKRPGKMVMLEANNEWEAAENVATWLAADEKANKGVAIVCGTGTDLLDQALAKRGLPAIGCGEPSRWRPYLQLLPLVLANMWTPIDIHRLADVLSLPISVIKRSDAFYLLKAIAEAPGVRGEKWYDALKSIEDRYVKRGLEKDPNSDVKKLTADAAKYAASIDEFLCDHRYPEADGAPGSAVQEKCRRVASRLRTFMAENPEYGTAISQAETLEQILDGKANIKRDLLDRIIDSIVEAMPNPAQAGEVSPWRVYASPGHIVSEVRDLVWWGFNEPEDSGLTYWTDDERAELETQGNPLDDQAAVRGREAAMFRKAADFVKGLAILVYSNKLDGEDAAYHPLWDELTAGLNRKKLPMIKANSLRKDMSWEFAGRRAEFLKKNREIVVEPGELKTIPEQLFKAPQKISPSQMSTMISCPLKWALSYQAGIRPAFALVVPEEHQIEGNLCHKIAEIVLGEVPGNTTLEAIRERAGIIYEELVPKMAAPLLAKGRRVEYGRLRTRMADAVMFLAQTIGEYGLKVDHVEKTFFDDLPDGTKVEGRMDVVLSDQAGNRFVIDMKWTGSAKKKEEEIADGRALQLAGYAWLLRPAEGGDSGAGYFLLAQGNFISDSPMLGHDAIDADANLQEVWALGLDSWAARAAEIDEGRLEATGVIWDNIKFAEDCGASKTNRLLQERFEQAGLLYCEPFCKYCDYRTLCGVKEAAE